MRHCKTYHQAYSSNNWCDYHYAYCSGCVSFENKEPEKKDATEAGVEVPVITRTEQKQSAA